MAAEVLMGDQRPRIFSVPPFVSSAGAEAVDLARHAGLDLDPWQAFVLEQSLGERADGKWASFEVGVIVSRQNGKGSILEARELAGLFLFGEELILHSAHEFKALDVDTPILTAAGWSTMGELVEGDEVFAPDGTLTKVVAAHPVRTGRPCFRLRFDDGQEVVADAEHLWAVEEVDGIRRAPQVLTTQQLVERGISTIAKRTGRDRRTYRFRVAVTAPLVCDDAELLVDPWLLGAWLGDGTTAKGELTVGTEDLPYVLKRLDELGETYRVREDRRTNGRVLTVIVEGLAKKLRALDVLGHKMIPARYMVASERQRRDLLAGLMDTDGTVSAHQIAVTMVKRELMEDVAALVRSLGYKASLREFRASVDGRDAGPMWRVQFSASQDISPFQMPRKSAKIRPRHARMTRSQYNAIVAIEPVISRPTRCITVAHESALYLVGSGFIPTHNTAQEAFRRVLGLIENTPDLDRRVARVRTSHGEEGIELRTGARLRFVARSTGSGRGFSGDCVILDEAYHLPDAAIDALMPTMSARPNPQLWYTTSAPDKDLAPCDQVARLRRRALQEGPADPSLAYLEWSIEPHGERCPADCTAHDDLADPRSWAKANPGMGIRIRAEHVAREYASMSAAGFLRERLGVGNYPSEGDGWTVIAEETWRPLADLDSAILGAPAFAIDLNPDRSAAAIAAAGRRADGQLHIEVIDHRGGTGWVVDRVVELVKRWKPVAVVLDAGGPGGSLLAPLEAAGIELVCPTARELGQACGQFYDTVAEQGLRHLDQAPLNAALAGAAKRPLGDAWAWARRGLSVDICPLVAVTEAAWAHLRYSSGDYDVLDSVW